MHVFSKNLASESYQLGRNYISSIRYEPDLRIQVVFGISAQVNGNTILGSTSCTSCGENLYATCCILTSSYRRKGSRWRTLVLEQDKNHLPTQGMEVADLQGYGLSMLQSAYHLQANSMALISWAVNIRLKIVYPEMSHWELPMRSMDPQRT